MFSIGKNVHGARYLTGRGHETPGGGRVKTRKPKTLYRRHNRIFGRDLDSADLFLLLNEIVDQNGG